MGEEITNEENEMGSWIEEAKVHFETIGGNTEYFDDDENSKKSKDINEKLKQLVENTFKDDELIIDKNGSKWNKQGHKILSSYLWYRVFYKDFGKNYPIVINASIDKDGLHCYIDIYDNRLHNDEDLKEKLGEILKEKLNEQNNNDFTTREEENDKYNFGYLDIKTEADFKEKAKKIIKIFKDVVKKVNEEIFKQMIKKYNSLRNDQISSKHCQINKKDQHYTKRKEIKNLVNNFLESPTEENFKAFWNKDRINSVQQGAQAINVIRENENIEILKEKIEQLIKLEINKNIEDEIKKQIKNAKNSALEFYYYYRMDKDDFPLINGGIKNAIKIIEENGISLNGDTIIEKMEYLKNKLFPDSETYLLEKYYFLDQFLNLIDKIKYDDINNERNENVKELYRLAFLFTNHFKVIKEVSNSKFFDELLQKSKNIILYGAPGTGKTYTSDQNILRILENEYDNSQIEENRYEKVQFHPSYSYEDFIEGLKPLLKNNQISLELQKGSFYKFCDIAREYEYKYNSADEKNKLKWAFFFLVDEINRAELSRVFGEIMYALDKRGNKIKTQYSYISNEEFSIPNNLYFIGTMNDVDRSIDSFDLALRRRFFWYRMDCDYSVIYEVLNDEEYQNIGKLNDKNIPTNGYLKSCYELNKFITNDGEKNLGLGKLYELGHSYFLNIKQHIKNKKIDKKALGSLFDFSIEQILKEYLRSEFDEKEIEKKLKEAKKIFQLKSNQDDRNS